MTDERAWIRVIAGVRGLLCGFGAAARDGRAIELPGVTAAVVPALHLRSLFNSVAFDTAGDLASALPVLGSVYEQAGVTAWGVWVPYYDVEAERLVHSSGFRLYSSPPAMIVGIERLAAPDDAAGLTRADRLDTFDQVIAEAYGYPPGSIADSLPRLLQAFRGYVGYDAGGTPACALATFEHDGVCAVNLVGTAPAARRERLASRLTAFALAEARERGCTACVVQATAAGIYLYDALGFRDLGPLNLWERCTVQSLTVRGVRRRSGAS